MYLEHFQLTDYPFIQSAKDELFFETDANSQLSSRVHYWLEAGHGMLLVTGVPGVGRTVLIQHAVQSCDLSVDCIAISACSLCDAELWRYIALEMGVKTTAQDAMSVRFAVKQQLQKIASEDRRVCLLIENAERLTADQLLLLEGLSRDYGLYLPLCHIVLEGDAAFIKSIRKGIKGQQSHVVTQVLEVLPMKEVQTRAYIEHRLNLVAENDDVLLSPALIKQIHVQAGGIPAAIDVLCDRVLIQAYEDDAATITLRHLTAAVRDLGWTQKFKSGKAASPKSKTTQPSGQRPTKTSVKNIAVKATTSRADTVEKVEKDTKTEGALEKSVHQLIRGVTTIGRAPDCSIQINEEDISPYQALIVTTEDGMFIRNEGGNIPIYLNASRVDNANLNDGDTVKIGSYELSLSTDTRGNVTLTSVPPLHTKSR